MSASAGRGTRIPGLAEQPPRRKRGSPSRKRAPKVEPELDADTTDSPKAHPTAPEFTPDVNLLGDCEESGSEESDAENAAWDFVVDKTFYGFVPKTNGLTHVLSAPSRLQTNMPFLDAPHKCLVKHCNSLPVPPCESLNDCDSNDTADGSNLKLGNDSDGSTTDYDSSGSPEATPLSTFHSGSDQTDDAQAHARSDSGIDATDSQEGKDDAANSQQCAAEEDEQLVEELKSSPKSRSMRRNRRRAELKLAAVDVPAENTSELAEADKVGPQEKKLEKDVAQSPGKKQKGKASSSEDAKAEPKVVEVATVASEVSSSSSASVTTGKRTLTRTCKQKPEASPASASASGPHIAAKSKEERRKLKREMLEVVLSKSGKTEKGEADTADRLAAEKLPKDHMKPVGVLTVKELGKYHCESDRMLISVYGDIFDVSSDPKRYGFAGKMAFYAGADVTWGLFVGRPTPLNTNRFYDLFKDTAALEKLPSLCSWIAFYTREFGEPVGRLDVYDRESELPAPPASDEPAECCLM